MGKKTKIYFKRNSTVYTLNNFPKSYNLIVQNWDIIVKKYQEVNEEYINETDKVKKVVKGMFAKVPKMTVSKERFEELRKDLKFKGNVVSFYVRSSSGRILDLTYKRDEDEEKNYELLNS